jgi:hypothetical protein
MYVPRIGALPSVITPRPEGLEEAATWKHESPAARSRPEKGFEEVPAVVVDEDTPREEKPAKKNARPVEIDEEPIVDADTPESSAKPKRKFSWFAALLVLLGMLGMGAVSAAPYLPKPSITGTGGFEKSIGSQKFEGNDPEFSTWLTVLAPCVAGGGLLCLLAGLIRRRFEFPSLAFLYIAAVAGAIVLLLSLLLYYNTSNQLAGLQRAVDHSKERGTQGDVTLNPGLQHYAVAGGAITGCLFFILAAVVMHRRWWSRILCVLFLSSFVGFAIGWIYQEELGIKEYFPEVIKQYMPV